MHHSPLLGPVDSLVSLSLVMYIWIYIARLGAMRRGRF